MKRTEKIVLLALIMLILCQLAKSPSETAVPPGSPPELPINVKRLLNRGYSPQDIQSAFDEPMPGLSPVTPSISRTETLSPEYYYRRGAERSLTRSPSPPVVARRYPQRSRKPKGWYYESEGFF